MGHGSEKRARSKHLTIRLTADERTSISEAAERAGLTIGSYARNILMGAPTPRQVRRPPIEKAELARLLGQIGYLGNNINQIARIMNGGGEADMPALNEALAGLGSVRNAILQALGRAP